MFLTYKLIGGQIGRAPASAQGLDQKHVSAQSAAQNVNGGKLIVERYGSNHDDVQRACCSRFVLIED